MSDTTQREDGRKRFSTTQPDLPKELRRQFSTRTPGLAIEILYLMGVDGGALTADEVLVGLYQIYKKIEKKSHVTNVLKRLCDDKKIVRVARGVYRLPHGQNEVTGG